MSHDSTIIAPWKAKRKGGGTPLCPRLAWNDPLGGHVISLTTPAAAGYPSTAPIALELFFFLPRPKNVADNVQWPSMCKPDNSNVRKAIEDAMTGVVYEDDKQIVDGADHKRFCYGDEEPYIRILLWKAGQRNG